MASPKIYQSGLNLAGTVFANGPATLQLGGPVYFSGAIQWVDTIDGDDANAGDKPELPVATLSQAITNSASNGIIVVGQGSSESISVGLTTGAKLGLHIFGCGIGSSRPRYTCTGAVDMLALSNGSWLEGFYFPASTAAATSRVYTSGDVCVVKDCYFECGASDTARSLNISSVSCKVSGCSFVTVAERPAIGLQISSSVTDTLIENCTFDGGAFGWSDYALKVSAAATHTTISGGTFANRSDIGFTITGCTYHIYGVEMDGTSNVELTA